jgi:hypothetical protein
MTGDCRFFRTAVCGLAALFGATSPARAEDPPVTPGGVEVLARGPVHEAFAQPAGGEPTPGPVAPKEPPKAIRLTLPEVSPAAGMPRPVVKAIPPAPVVPKHEGRPFPQAVPTVPKQAPPAKKPETK